MEKVYHASKIKNIKVFKPKMHSFYKKKWVFAAKDKMVASIFLGNVGGDHTCTTKRNKETNKMTIIERFPGGFKERYKRKKGYIYVFDKKDFFDAEGIWTEELVSDKNVKPIDIIEIKDVKSYLINLNKKGKIDIEFCDDEKNLKEFNSFLLKNNFFKNANLKGKINYTYLMFRYHRYMFWDFLLDIVKK